MSMVIKSLVTTVLYFFSSMTCTLNVVKECCDGKEKVHHHEANHFKQHHPPHSHSKDPHHHSHGKCAHDKSHPSQPKMCCDTLITTLTSSAKLFLKNFLSGFQTLDKVYNQKYFIPQKHLWIHETDPPPIRGRPLYKTLYSINAPPAHP